VRSGVTSGVVTDDSETFRLDILESELAGGACGAPDRRTTHRVRHSLSFLSP